LISEDLEIHSIEPKVIPQSQMSSATSAPKPQSKKLSWSQEFLVAASAGTSACFFTNPIEVVKTRLQLQGELMSPTQKGPFRNPLDALAKIGANEGIHGLQAGLLPAIMYQITMNGVRLGTYSSFKTFFNANDPNDPYFFPKSVAAGAFCGAVGGVTGNPFFLIKVRLQNFARDASLSVGFQHNYSSSFDAVRSIFASEGVFGLWRGVQAQVLRVSTGSAVQLGTYDSIKAFILKSTNYFEDGTSLHFLSSAITGYFVTVAMNPFDVVATRLYNQQVINGKGVLYKGTFDCLTKTIRTEGFFALYKGFWPHYFRLCPHTILTFIFWEKYKKLALQYVN
jgi:solute carrier family 25 protein 34/35